MHRIAFKNISGFHTKHSLLCQDCIDNLDGYLKYRKRVQEKHRSIGHATVEPVAGISNPPPNRTAFSCLHCPYTSTSTDQLKRHNVTAHQVSSNDSTLCHWIKIEEEEEEVGQSSAVILFDPIKTEIKEEVEEEVMDEVLIPTVTEKSKVEARPRVRSKVLQLPQGESTRSTATGYLECVDCQKIMTQQELFEHRKKRIESSREAYESQILRKNKKCAPTPVADDPNVFCPICSKVMKESKLNQHTKYNHVKKDLLCQYCPKKFAHRSFLQYHINQHEGTMPFKCDLCDFSENCKSNLSNHIRHVHLKIPEHQCPICQQKSFHKKFNLKDHMKSFHPKGKDSGLRVNPETNYFDCKKCGASYLNMKIFLTHSCKRGLLQLRCPECNKPCKNREKVQKHMKKVHSQQKTK